MMLAYSELSWQHTLQPREDDFLRSNIAAAEKTKWHHTPIAATFGGGLRSRILTDAFVCFLQKWDAKRRENTTT